MTTSQSRSRENSYKEAWNTMILKLDNVTQNSYTSKVANYRKQQVGTGMRGDKIRTYQFQYDQVKDHQTGKHATCNKIMRGYFELLW